MTTHALSHPVKDNPLSGAETTFLIVGGLIAVGLVGGVIYVATKKPTTTTMTTPGGGTTAPTVSTQGASVVQPGQTYLLSSNVYGAAADGSQANSAVPVMTEDQFNQILPTLAWTNVQVLWWGPTQTLTDPSGYLGLNTWVGKLLAARRQTADHAGGIYLAIATWNGPANTPVPSTLSAFPVG